MLNIKSFIQNHSPIEPDPVVYMWWKVLPSGHFLKWLIYDSLRFSMMKVFETKRKFKPSSKSQKRSLNRALKSSKNNAFNQTPLLRSYKESKHIFEAGLRLGLGCALLPEATLCLET